MSKLGKKISETLRGLLERPLYSLGIKAYALGIRIATVGNHKAKLLIQGHKQIRATLSAKIAPTDRPIWVHAASLGEFEQGRPLMELIRRRHPDTPILLTFFSPSGYQVRKNYDGADCVCYMPFDTRRRAKQFLKAVNPRMAIFVKYEIWRNHLQLLHELEIPTYLISATFRPQQKYFSRRCSWASNWLKYFTRIFVQDADSKALLQSIGIENAVVAGDTRFDRVTDIMRSTRPLPLIEQFAGSSPRTTIIFGSSWGADEDHYFSWLKKHQAIAKSIIAPHEFSPERLASIKARLAPECKAVLLSEVEAETSLLQGADCLIIDCFGLLSSAYRYAQIAYIGGGFGVGIHNINEAAVYGIPVIFGPNHHKFIEAREIIAAGGGFSVADTDSLHTLLSTLTASETAPRLAAGKAAAEYINSKLGATQIIANHLNI